MPTLDELKVAYAVEVYDRTGNKQPLGALVEGKRTLLVFTRHFCKLNCQAVGCD